MKVMQPLNLELQIYCVSLMIKMGIDGNVINIALRVMNKGAIINRDNPLGSYNELYDKLRYYENIPGISDAIANINSYIQEMFICLDEDYVVFKDMIFEEMSSIESSIPRSYEYEFVEGMILSKK